MALDGARSIFENLTPNTQEESVKSFLKLDVSSDAETAKAIVDMILEMATEKPHLCPLFAEICKAQKDADFAKCNQKLYFREALLGRAQTEFTGRSAEEREAKVEAVEAEPNLMEKLRLLNDLALTDAEFRRKRFGCTRLIGHLYCQGMISDPILNSCVYKLVKIVLVAPAPFPEHVEESVACAIRLLETTAKKISEKLSNRREVQDMQSDLQKYVTYLKYIRPDFSSRIRLMIDNLVRLRENNWVQ